MSMSLPEMVDFLGDPSVEVAMRLGRAIVELDEGVEEKRMLFQDAFEIAVVDEELEAVLNMWAVAAMLEDVLPEVQIIQAVRGFINDPFLTPALMEEWIRVVYRVRRGDPEMLDFIAVDLRNIKGISAETRNLLGHPSPDHPFKED